ncbi:alanine racemase [Jiella pelagia]|uniref:alanine racemase n=1 Tax=Jiella pelagia TaxID=2986949 RepID=UPI0038B3BA4A
MSSASTPCPPSIRSKKSSTAPAGPGGKIAASPWPSSSTPGSAGSASTRAKWRSWHARRSLLAGLDIRCYVSHLAAYNLPEDPSNDVQRRLLETLVAMLPAAPISLAASSGVYMGEHWHYDIARVGSALFGIQTSDRPQDGLQPCYDLSAPILAVAEHPAGRRVGYRGVTELRRPSRIATAAIGYANGLPQGYMTAGVAHVGGHAVPLVGGIAMNMTMLDVTDLPAALCPPGARATFFGAAQPIEPVAESLGCAPNAILTQIGSGTRKIHSGGT